jgi:CYTH domain-containing protein/CHAD domain-containing protein
MAFVLEPGPRMQREVRSVAAQRLDDAIERLDQVGADTEADLETIVHEVRKRCKAVRGLARLVKPALGDDFRSFDRTVRSAANELSSLRDAHAVVATFDALLATEPDDDVLRTMRDRQAAMSSGATRSAGEADDGRIDAARHVLAEARDASQRWKIPRGFDTIEAGVAATYRQGRSALRRVRADPTDIRLHEWRKAVKYLWYQMQLLHEAAPSVLDPLVDRLDLLAEALGDDHDLSVLVELLDTRPDDYGTAGDVDHVRALARRRQHTLRRYAIRSGATIYAEPDHAFVNRIARYWHLTLDAGPEPHELDPVPEAPERSLVERERKFLIEVVPDDLVRSDVTELRQGYLATGTRGSVRVRDAGRDGCTLTVKAGSGGERTELEWSIERREFDAAWPHTEGRRIEKARHRIPSGGHVVELDVFAGDLDGLVMAEVEFTSSGEMAAFVPPAWFGREVTDDDGYTNASLALHGRPAG